MSTQIVAEYKHLVNIIPDIIDASGYRNDSIAKKLGMKAKNFSVKKQRSSWTANEVERFLKVVDNEEVENFIMLEIMRSRKNDETVPLSELKEEFGWK